MAIRSGWYTKMFGAAAVLLVLLFVGYFLMPQPTNADAVSCPERYYHGAGVPFAYGAPYNVFSSSTDLLLTTACQDGGSSVSFNIVTQTNSHKIVYKTGYLWNGAQWTPLTLGGNAASGDWLELTASTSISVSVLRPPATFNYFVFYTCTEVGGAWQCGCRDTVCAEHKWQIQAFRTPRPIAGVTSGTTVGTGVTTGTTAGGTTTGGTGSGNGGINLPSGPFSGTSGDIAAFEQSTGRTIRIRHQFSGNSKEDGQWSVSEGNAGMFTEMKNYLTGHPDNRILFSYSIIPGSLGRAGAALSSCASGAFNEHYRQFALNMKTLGITNLFIQPGWEFNVASWPWGAGSDLTKAAWYRDCYKNFVDTVELNYPENNFKYIWTVNQDASLATMESGWPGINYVDVIGVNLYDTWFSPSCNNGADVVCRWENRQLKNLQEKMKPFADSHGNKPLSFDEWAVSEPQVGQDSRGGGDNPYFIQKSCEWFNNPTNRVVWYAYFDANGVYDHRLSTHPLVRQALRDHCSSNTSSAGGL